MIGMEGIIMDMIDIFLQILSSHHLSQRAVCEILGFSSANQVTRILKRQVSHKYLIKFGSLLLKHSGELGLTDGEISQLQACCMSLGLNTDDETAASIFFSTISRLAEPPRGASLLLYDAQGASVGPFESVFFGASDLSLSIVGCLNTPFCSILDSLAVHCSVNVDYYHPEGKGTSLSAQYLRSIWPFLHKPWFHPYCVRRKQDAVCDGLINADVALIDAAFPDGTRRSYMLVPQSAGTAHLLPFPKEHLPYRMLLFSGEDTVYSLEIPQENEENYIQYLRYLQDLEHNHRAFLIKADICLNMIPAEIQLRALREGPMSSYPDIGDILMPMYTIEKERFENNRDKKRHQYYLHTYDGLRSFMETGVETDHFWGFRPFTPQERYQILSGLYDRAANSPYTHLFFLKPGIQLIPDEIGWYEDRGICFLLPQTHYHIEGGHSELLFRDPAFCRFFSGYFRKWLCQHHALSEADSLNKLHNLLEQFS